MAQELARRQVRYSRVVAVMKLVLPLTALVLLSLVFLLARTVDPRAAIATAAIDVEDRARDPRLSGARFAGVTEDGAALTIVTESARSDPSGAMRLRVSGLDLRVEGARGERFGARAETGSIDRGRGRFEMEGGIRINATPGYVLSTERLSGSLDSTHLIAPGMLQGQAPAGEISAGNFEMRADSRPEGGYRLVFGGGVRFNYQPFE